MSLIKLMSDDGMLLLSRFLASGFSFYMKLKDA